MKWRTPTEEEKTERVRRMQETSNLADCLDDLQIQVRELSALKGCLDTGYCAIDKFEDEIQMRDGLAGILLSGSVSAGLIAGAMQSTLSELSKTLEAIRSRKSQSAGEKKSPCSAATETEAHSKNPCLQYSKNKRKSKEPLHEEDKLGGELNDQA